MDNLLFVYGTLLNDDNGYAVYLKNNSTFYSEGRLKGKLYDIGAYPGAILSNDKDNYVCGNVRQMADPAKVLPVIDDYEGFGNHQVQPNEFIRAWAEVETTTGVLFCWVYVYNLPVGSLTLIESGRYLP